LLLVISAVLAVGVCLLIRTVCTIGWGGVPVLALLGYVLLLKTILTRL
jgi:hypothetical protein